MIQIYVFTYLSTCTMLLEHILEPVVSSMIRNAFTGILQVGKV